MRNDDIFSQTKKSVIEFAEKFNINKQKIEVLLEPTRIVKVKIAIHSKNGKTKIFTGFRSQHNNKLGPYKGGIRFHQNVTESEIKTLSFLMSLKCAVLNLPLGGGKGGVIVNPKNLTEKELEDLSRDYVRKIYDVIGPTKDIPAPDVNTNSKIMSWMIDEYIKISKEKGVNLSENALYATFTGKSEKIHGLSGRTEATGFGGVAILCRLVKKLGLKENNLTVAVQGFGNVGYHFAEFASKRGFIIAAVSDSKGATINKQNKFEPLDISLVQDCKRKKGYVSGCYCVGGVCDMTKGRKITNEQLLELPVDILVPAALENVINIHNMKRIKARIIIEMANGPITPEAYKYLIKKGKIIVPDILSNAGGVTGSYLEWKQNIENKRYKKEEALKMIENMMNDSFDHLWLTAKKKNISLKDSAYIYSLSKLI